ncbi:MAG: CaiB/BaiF CoA-transferase family protein [Lapillicoccus sp.]
MTEDGQPGPLAGVRVVELAGIGPAPFCVMLLADMGASVVRVDRVGLASGDYAMNPVIERGRRSVAVDLKNAAGVQVVLDLVRDADVLLESYRPGVVERLGIGPDACQVVNDRLVYARLSGFGQDGPWAGVAGHDINYIGLTGALWSIGRAGDRPVPPINLVGDLGGGAASMAFGIVCALLEARASGRGQVVDANVLDATTTIMGFVQGLRAQGQWSLERGTNMLDTGCPYYDTYACADGRWVAVGTVEERFFLVALDVLGFAEDDPLRRAHKDRSLWPALRTGLTEAFATRTRDEWADRFRPHDACVTPVLDLDEATRHEQVAARGAYQPIPGFDVPQPAVAPRFSRSGTPVPPPPPHIGEHTDAVLTELGYAPERIASLRSAGVVA